MKNGDILEINNLKTQIENLIKLQKVDSEIYALGNEKAVKPSEIKAIQETFESKKQNLLNLQKQSLELQKQRKEKELELATNVDAVKKLQSQIYSLKTNKEFQVMQQQIADKIADGSVIEENILISYEETDKIKAQIDQENLKLNDEEKNFLVQKKMLEERIKEIDSQLSQLDSQRKQIIPSIDQNMLSEYDRILHSREGLAIVGVEDNSCGGCHMLVPPQVINLIKMYDEIITCETCNRILCIKE